jgi:hypothetical protein
MVIRLAGLGILAVVLAGWTTARDPTFQVAQNLESSDKAADAGQLADREMMIGRYNIGKRNYTGAVNRFKTVVTQYPLDALRLSGLEPAENERSYISRAFH